MSIFGGYKWASAVLSCVPLTIIISLVFLKQTSLWFYTLSSTVYTNTSTSMPSEQIQNIDVPAVEGNQTQHGEASPSSSISGSAMTQNSSSTLSNKVHTPSVKVSTASPTPSLSNSVTASISPLAPFNKPLETVQPVEEEGATNGTKELQVLFGEKRPILDLERWINQGNTTLYANCCEWQCWRMCYDLARRRMVVNDAVLSILPRNAFFDYFLPAVRPAHQPPKPKKGGASKSSEPQQYFHYEGNTLMLLMTGNIYHDMVILFNGISILSEENGPGKPPRQVDRAMIFPADEGPWQSSMRKLMLPSFPLLTSRIPLVMAPPGSLACAEWAVINTGDPAIPWDSNNQLTFIP